MRYQANAAKPARSTTATNATLARVSTLVFIAPPPRAHEGTTERMKELGPRGAGDVLPAPYSSISTCLTKLVPDSKVTFTSVPATETPAGLVVGGVTASRNAASV